MVSSAIPFPAPFLRLVISPQVNPFLLTSLKQYRVKNYIKKRPKLLTHQKWKLKNRSYSLLLRTPAGGVILWYQPIGLPFPAEGTTKRHAREEFLNYLSRDDISDENSDSSLDDIVHGGYSEGRNLLATRRSQAVTVATFPASPALDPAKKRTGRRKGIPGNTGVPGAVVVRFGSTNRALAALANYDPSGHPNHPSKYTPPSSPPERKNVTWLLTT